MKFLGCYCVRVVGEACIEIFSLIRRRDGCSFFLFVKFFLLFIGWLLLFPFEWRFWQQDSLLQFFPDGIGIVVDWRTFSWFCLRHLADSYQKENTGDCGKIGDVFHEARWELCFFSALKEGYCIPFIAQANIRQSASPIRLAIVLQEFSPEVRAGVDAGDDRVHDARRAVHEGFAARQFGLEYTYFSRIVCIK